MANATYKPRTIQERLDDIKAAHDLPSDYKLALFLGLGETAVANYRKGRSLPDPDAAIKIANASGVEPALLMMEIEAFRAKSTAAKVAWGTGLALMATALMISRPGRGGSGTGKGAVNITSAASTSAEYTSYQALWQALKAALAPVSHAPMAPA